MNFISLVSISFNKDWISFHSKVYLKNDNNKYQFNSANTVGIGDYQLHRGSISFCECIPDNQEVASHKLRNTVLLHNTCLHVYIHTIKQIHRVTMYIATDHQKKTINLNDSSSCNISAIT